MSANVAKKRNTSEAFAAEVNHADEPRKRPTTMDQARSLKERLPSSSIHPPERPESVLSSLAIQHGDLEDVKKPELYTYKSLVSDQIRLLHLHSGQWDDPIHCSLATDSISAPSSYEALSYTWGEPHPAQKILLSDEETVGSFTTPRTSLVTPNLYDALRNIRSSDRPLVLWVDALCIDQTSTTERNHQVGLMTKIYSNAHRVLVWLGNENTSTSWAVSNIRGVLSLNTSSSTTPDAPCETMALCSAWNEYVRSPWFGRMWVLQELAFARRATFIRGHSQLDSQDLELIVDLILQHVSSRNDVEVDLPRSARPSEDFYFRPLHDAAQLFKLSRSSITRSSDGLGSVGSNRSLFQAMKETSHLSATDPRDNIYALLGIVNQGSVRSWIVPDYNLSFPQILKNVIKLEIKDSQSLDILTRGFEFLFYVIETERKENPSWICLEDAVKYPGHSWNKAVSRIGPELTGIARSFTASKDFLPNVRFQHYARSPSTLPPTRSSVSKYPDRRPKFCDDIGVINDSLAITGDVLVASGIEIGTITDVSMRMAGGIVSRDCLEMAGMSFSEGCEALQNKPRTVWERLWRILVADRNNEGFAAPTSFGLAFFKLFKQILRLRCIDTEETLKTETDQNNVEFLSRVRDVVLDRRMFSSSGVNHYEETLVGLVPKEAQLGDQIVILFGGSVPIVIRAAKDNHVKIVGEAYVHGKMHGEAFHGLGEEALVDRIREFRIV